MDERGLLHYDALWNSRYATDEAVRDQAQDALRTDAPKSQKFAEDFQLFLDQHPELSNELLDTVAGTETKEEE
ncbi:MAG TPA: hypothetical protein VFW90_00650 [Candidatus Saccharimonadales bacterium]|nr:hypothetical protein [Candidatus Saccharimonadales bacterium]